MRSFVLLLSLALYAAAPAAQEAPRSSAPTAYPNPVGQGPLTIQYAADGHAEAPAVEVFDVLGRRVTPDGALPAGTYLYRLRWADGRVSAAGRLTKLTAAPLDVHLVPSPASSSMAPAAASSSAAGCDDGLLWSGVRHAPLGVAEVETAIPAVLTISNLGGSGQDGVRTCLGNTAGTAVAFVDGADFLVWQRLVWDLDKDGLPGNGTLARASFEAAGGDVEAAVDFSGMGATSLILEGYDGPDLVCTSTTSGAQRTFSLAPMDGGVVLEKASLSVVFEGSEAAGAGHDPGRSLLLHYEMSFSWGASRPALLCNGQFVAVDHIRLRTDLRPAVQANAVVRESRMRFAGSGNEVAMEELTLNAMGHAHAAWRDLVALGDASEFVADSPLGPLSVVCAQSGCVRGLEILAPPGSDRLHADFQPFRIQAGSSGVFELFYEYDVLEQAGSRTLVPPLKLTIAGRPGGIVLRMDKDICDEAPASNECRVRFEYVRNGVVRMQRTVRAGTAVPVNRSLTVRSVEVFMDDAPDGQEKPPSWTITLGVSLLGGNEVLRISGQGETAAALHGYGVVWGLLDEPFKVTGVWNCPGDAACPPVGLPPAPVAPDADVPFLFGEAFE